MCGIAGILNFDGSPVKSSQLKSMTLKLAHRGPDNMGLWLEKNIGFGHRRLSIRDLTSAGNQPMLDPDGRVVVVFNGEIYNYEKLKQELEIKHGCVFRTSSDTEIITVGFPIWGAELFKRLEGMFAIALWDRKREQLYLTRDSLGIKPLYLYEDSTKTFFASEIKAFSKDIEIKLNPASIHTYLAAGYPGPSSTLIERVRQLEPGSMEIFAKKGNSKVKFWQPRRSGEIQNLQEAMEEFKNILPTVVSEHMLSDVPVGIFQSGGIDSSLVSLSLKKMGITPPLFTASFSEKTHDESDLANEIGKNTGSRQKFIKISSHANFEEDLKRIVYHFDGQCADTGAYPFFKLCESVQNRFKVILSGDGGDEFFGGYETYRASAYASLLNKFIPAGISKKIGEKSYYLYPRDTSRLPLVDKISRFFLGLGYGGSRAHMQWRRLVPAFLLPQLYGKGLEKFKEATPYFEYEAYSQVDGEKIDRWLLADQQFHLQSILAKVDGMSMANSIEIRVPLLDRRIVEFAGKCHSSLLMPPNQAGKYLLRRVVESLGAPKSIHSAKKMGFNTPIAKALREDLAPLGRRLLFKNPDILAPYFKPDSIQRIWKEHSTQECNHGYSLWPILSLAIWKSSL